MKIAYVNLGTKDPVIKTAILDAIGKVLESGQFILGESVKVFEDKFAELCQTNFALGVASGTDALLLTMKALGIGKGDEVITTPNSFLASASSIALAGATPVFADVRDDYNIDPEKIQQAITSKTKAIIPVHLTGRPADMDAIFKMTEPYKIFVIEDAAQAVRAEYKGKRVGSFGIAGCFSFHPLKNLGGCGDGGMITTNDEKLYNKLLILRNHGLINRDECEIWGYNSRLDALQAVILNVKLDHLKNWETRKREIAGIYQKRLIYCVKVPMDKSSEHAVYHTFIIQTKKRDSLKNYLMEKGIDAKIHYPIPIHLQKAAQNLGYKKGDFPVAEEQTKTILSLPIYPELTDNQVDYICDNILKFLN